MRSPGASEAPSCTATSSKPRPRFALRLETGSGTRCGAAKPLANPGLGVSTLEMSRTPVISGSSLSRAWPYSSA